MTSFQTFFIAFTFLVPLGLWQVNRRLKSERFDRVASRTMALVLILTYGCDLSLSIIQGRFAPHLTLPMQLCDWALFAVAAALWFGSQTGFELGYFWGLAGTLQALFTPALDAGVGFWRLLGFFTAHAVIVAGVLYLMLARGFRPWPRSSLRVVIWSEVFLGTALAVNALTGGNYGFLSEKPPVRSMLDLFAEPGWIYWVQLNLTAFAFFAVLYAPWFVYDRLNGQRSVSPTLPA